jgi:hypothetical protein
MIPGAILMRSTIVNAADDDAFALGRALWPPPEDE